MADVWAYVAHKDGMFVGAMAAQLSSKKEIAKFCGDFIADGFDITPTYSRDEYLALIGPMGEWKPLKARTGPKPTQQADLFSAKEERP